MSFQARTVASWCVSYRRMKNSSSPESSRHLFNVQIRPARADFCLCVPMSRRVAHPNYRGKLSRAVHARYREFRPPCQIRPVDETPIWLPEIWPSFLFENVNTRCLQELPGNPT